MAFQTNSKQSLTRISLVSSNTGVIQPDGEFKGLDTPVDVEGGALRAGGAPNLYAKENIGLLINYAAVGLIWGTFPQTIYPFLINYLQLDGYQGDAARELASLAWSFKTFIGIISDSFPIFGFRRRPYMVLGCFQNGLVASDFQRNKTHITYELTNPEAPLSGTKYILLMMFASIGNVVADVAADAIVVEYAQREPIEVRGTTQTMIYATRFLFDAVAKVIIGFGLNGKDYCGSFDFSITFAHVMVILAVGCAIAIPSSWFFVQEDHVERESFTARCMQTWEMIKRRSIWQIMAYTFFSSIFYNFSTTTSLTIGAFWAGVEPINDSLSGVITSLMVAGTLFAMKKYGLNWSWRRTIIVTVVAIVVVDVFVMVLTIYDIVRSQWFYLGVPLVTNLPGAIHFIIQTYASVEVADPGYEGATYGLMSTVNNLAGPFSTSITKQVNAEFDVFRDDIKLDSNHVRDDAMIVHIISWCSKFFSLVFLVLLPRQKKETQELKAKGGTSALAGTIALLLATFCLTWGVVTNLMSIFPSTACLKIAGGKGCDN